MSLTLERYGGGTQQPSFTWVGNVVNCGRSERTSAGMRRSVQRRAHEACIDLRPGSPRQEIAGSMSPIQFLPYEQAYKVALEDM